MSETKLAENLQKVRDSEGSVFAMALADTQLPPQMTMETTMRIVKSEASLEGADSAEGVIFFTRPVHCFLKKGRALKDGARKF